MAAIDLANFSALLETPSASRWCASTAGSRACAAPAAAAIGLYQAAGTIAVRPWRVLLDGLDLIGMRRHDGIPGHVSADQGGIDVDHLARGDLGHHTGLGRAGQDGLEALCAPTLADAGQGRVVRQGLMQA